MSEIVVSGTGRCGTGYIAQVLSSAGRPCTHEGVFNRQGWEYAWEQMQLRIANPHWDFHAESSWLAAPFLDKPELEDATVVHLVRHPKDVLDSFLRLMVYTHPTYGPYYKWMAEKIPQIEALERPEDRAAYWYIKLNQMVERRADITHRVEDDPRDLLDKLGIEHYWDKELFNNRKYNARPGYGPSNVMPEDISIPALHTELLRMTERYGYSWADHRPKTVTAKWFDGQEIEIDANAAMLGGAWQLRDDKGTPLCYDAPLVKFFYRQAQDYVDPVVVDVGASSGNFALLAKLHAGMEVHAFEPNPVQFRALKTNVNLHQVGDQIVLYECALSDYDAGGTLMAPIPALHAAVACLADGCPRCRGFDWTQIAIEVHRLDSFGIAPDLLKIDVEGAELMVLRGAEETINLYHPLILMEYTSLNTRQFGYEREEIVEWLKAHGYTQFREVGVEDLWAEP